MNRLLLLLISLLSVNYSYAQIPIATQGFENGDSWSYTTFPEFYNFQNGDVFDIIEGEYQSMSPSSGSHFVAFHDLENPNVVSGETSNYYHYITFSTLMIPQPSPEDLKLSFKYISVEFDGPDYMAYELQFDNSDTWFSNWSSSVDTTYEFSQYLSKDTDQQWVLHTIDIPDTVSFLRFRIGAKQNGGADWAGLDDIFLYYDSEGDFIAPNVIDASIINDQQIVLTFDEVVQSATASIEGYNIQSSILNSEGTQLTINLSSPLIDGDYFTITFEELTDIAGNINSFTLENLVHNDHVGNLVITEINYNDPGPYDNLDYIEIYNNGDEAYPLGGLQFNTGVNVSFSEYSLEAGEYIIVAQPAYFLNDACGALTYGCGFQSYFGFAPQFEIESGYLGAGTLSCINTVGETVIYLDFDDSGDWPIAVSNGYSIVLCDPSSDMNDPLNWSLSSAIQYAVDPTEAVLDAMGLSGYTQYYADPAAPCPEGDILPPVVISIYPLDEQTVVVVYDEAIFVDGTYDGIDVSSSTISGDTVTLTLSTPLVLGSAYPVTISGTEDQAGNAIQGYGVDLFYNTVANLFFSEYAEGTASNKYLEIFNPGEDTVDLSFYALASTSNAPTVVGVYEFWRQFPEGSFVAPGEVYIIADPGANDVEILPFANATVGWPDFVLSNGDDGFALVYGSEPATPVGPEAGGYTIVDLIGDWNGDPGFGWEVAGVSSATFNRTLVRKCWVEQGNDDWSVSAGTTIENSEWLVLDNEDWSNLGQHETPCPDNILGCTDALASNFNPLATDDDGSCIFLGCTDQEATNYDPIAQTDDGSCIYPLEPLVNLFFSEYAEGSSNNKYLEIYNPTSDTVSLQFYAFPSVGNAPDNGEGIYEYWNDFPPNAVILPNDVYVIAHPEADASILALANTTHQYLSNGDDGYALVHGYQPATPTDPQTGGYTIIDFVGDWNGDPGTAWDVAGIVNATQNHTLVRKCGIEDGNSDWTASAGTNADDSEWLVYDQNTWTYLGSHLATNCDGEVFGCTDIAACNYDEAATVNDGSCEFPNDCGSCEGDISCLVEVAVSVDMNEEGFDASGGFSHDYSTRWRAMARHVRRRRR
ncbi:lamin tail domain-containing protein [Flavobacteriales bacterium]|nr:lamin tail domain-containing protein [Flavobacteriales bacterium]